MQRENHASRSSSEGGGSGGERSNSQIRVESIASVAYEMPQVGEFYGSCVWNREYRAKNRLPPGRFPVCQSQIGVVGRFDDLSRNVVLRDLGILVGENLAYGSRWHQSNFIRHIWRLSKSSKYRNVEIFKKIKRVLHNAPRTVQAVSLKDRNFLGMDIVEKDYSCPHRLAPNTIAGAEEVAPRAYDDPCITCFLEKHVGDKVHAQGTIIPHSRNASLLSDKTKSMSELLNVANAQLLTAISNYNKCVDAMVTSAMDDCANTHDILLWNAADEKVDSHLQQGLETRKALANEGLRHMTRRHMLKMLVDRELAHYVPCQQIYVGDPLPKGKGSVLSYCILMDEEPLFQPVHFYTEFLEDTLYILSRPIRLSLFDEQLNRVPVSTEIDPNSKEQRVRALPTQYRCEAAAQAMACIQTPFEDWAPSARTALTSVKFFYMQSGQYLLTLSLDFTQVVARWKPHGNQGGLRTRVIHLGYKQPTEQ